MLSYHDLETMEALSGLACWCWCLIPVGADTEGGREYMVGGVLGAEGEELFDEEVQESATTEQGEQGGDG